MTDPTLRVRFAPSPTGFLHVGGARTALFNYLLARHHGGTFILRIEDTDLERSTEEATAQILESLQWLGVQWDEGPYSQRERAPRHREVAERLIADGKAYRCFTPNEEVEALQKAAVAAKQTFAFRGKDRDLTPEESAARATAGEACCVRFKIPDGAQTVVEDGLAGPVVFDHSVLGDFVILRPDGNPVYNFACAVDDVDMKISHVLRGNDHLSNTPRQILVVRAMGAEPPKYTHVPLIMKAGKKMSKRDADADPSFPVSVHARRDLGYLPEATVNFISLLGWSYDAEQETFTMEQAIERFTGEGLTASAANFDEDKFTWMNAWYIRNLPKEVIVPRATGFMKAAGLDVEGRDPAWLDGIIGLAIERVHYLRDFASHLEYFFKAPTSFDAKGLKKVFGKDGVSGILRKTAEALDETVPFTIEAMEERMKTFCEETGEKFGNIAQPARLALTGRTATPGIFEVMFFLGREECVKRLRDAAQGIDDGTLVAPPSGS